MHNKMFLMVENRGDEEDRRSNSWISQRRERGAMVIFEQEKKSGKREREEGSVQSRNKIIKKLCFSDKFAEKTI